MHYFLANLINQTKSTTGTTHKNKYNNDYRTTNSTMMLKIPIAWKNMPPTIPFDWKSIKSLGKTRRGRKRKHAPSNPAAVMHQQKRTRVNDDYDDDIDERIRPPDFHHAIPEPKESDIPKSALYSEPEVDDNDSVNEILHPQIHDPITAGANNVEDSLCYSDSDRDSDSDNSVIFRESFADDLILGLLCLNDVEEEQNSPSFFPSSPPLPQLRRSQRLANEATTLMSLPPQLPLLRRSPRLALKPRTSYVGMC